MRIGIYGGTFNPVHIGHMHVAETAMNDLGLDIVYFVPSKKPYTKPNDIMAPYEDRCQMIKIAAGYADFEVADDGSKDGENTYTYITIEKFRAEHPDDKLYFIAGEDAYLDMNSWKNPERIFKNIDGIYVLRRKTENSLSDEELKAVHSDKTNVYIHIEYYYEHNILSGLSSTTIRNFIKYMQPCRYLLPYQVYDYIIFNKLYSQK